ncbi:hypothetical protein IFM89_018041 [Coptis chinensis]|uniref:Uncharacterized protein n=1 Tax=Coptis chinensis TaxID=261450 RepID=A0A835HYJ3_9MAGN|nr:hypothetical protein IFM89_018041 [Coptis chinensis]
MNKFCWARAVLEELKHQVVNEYNMQRAFSGCTLLLHLKEHCEHVYRLTKSKEAALLEAERTIQIALAKAPLVDELQNKNQELMKQIEICQESLRNNNELFGMASCTIQEFYSFSLYIGDKYENKIITHRPPPIQYRSGRYGDMKRSNGRPPMQPRNQSYDHQGSAQGDRKNYAPQM